MPRDILCINYIMFIVCERGNQLKNPAMRKNSAITVHLFNACSLALCYFGHNALESTQQKTKSISY